MTGRFYIDGRDAYEEFGIFIETGGYDRLVQYPSLKKIESNDWAEEDGIEPDLSDPALDSLDVVIKFAAHGDSLVGDFFVLLSDFAYHTFEFREIGRTYYLRLTNQGSNTVKIRLDKFSLTFANDFPFDGLNYTGTLPEDFPLTPYSYIAPASAIPPPTGYIMDDRDLSEYGIFVLKGSLAEIRKSPAVKKNLSSASLTLNGMVYDGEFVKFQTKDVKLNCLMRAANLAEFWRNYNAFLYDLVRPEHRMLYIDMEGYEYPCHYKSCAVTRFAPTNKIWFQFTLTLVFISFRINEEEFLLAGEDDFLIIDEEEEYFIDLK